LICYSGRRWSDAGVGCQREPFLTPCLLAGMSSRRPKTRPNSRQLRTLCADLSPEDGVDPRLLARGGSDSPDRRKTWQLCSQVHDSLRLIMGEAADERLHSLEVREVLPAPNDSQLLVLLVPLDPLTDVEREEVAAALQVAAGWLRSEIASAITRKRAPRLVLQLLPTAPITAN
jgi:ribosome-binding factor A